MLQAKPTRPHLENIDFLRFVSSTIVLLSHVGTYFPIAGINSFGSDDKHFVVRSALQLLFNGPAAVMLFFVISGICINLPYTNNRAVSVIEFYSRRYIRIGPPLLVAYVLSVCVSGHYDFSALPVVWSLWCEAIYYLFYPVILLSISFMGFGKTFGLSCLASFLLSLVPDQTNGHAWLYGPFLTWIIFLPVWLSGIWISENVHLAKTLPLMLRSRGFALFGGLFVFVLSVLWTILLFHVDGGIKYPLYMLLIFSAFGAVFVFLMLGVSFSEYPILRFLDRQGRWSYSLYLVNFPTLYLVTILASHLGVRDLTQTTYLVWSAITFAVAYVIANIFYWLFEKPSHDLAKKVGSGFQSLPYFVIRRSLPPATAP